MVNDMLKRTKFPERISSFKFFIPYLLLGCAVLTTSLFFLA